MEKATNIKFEIQKKIKSGTYSNLYTIKYDDTLALYKEFSGSMIDKKNYFKTNYQMLCTISHPNLIRMLKWCEQNGKFGFIMEYFPGSELSLLKNRSEKTIIKTIIDVCAGLDVIHEKGLVHRDITPDNILYHEKLGTKITDFDWMINTKDDYFEDEFTGKVKYISPEQCRREKQIDQRSDLYSLGIILYELIYGKVQFDGEEWLHIAKNHIEKNIYLLCLIYPL